MLATETQVSDHRLEVSDVWMGLDLSLTSTGMAVLSDRHLVSYRIKSDRLRGLDRLKQVLDHIVLRVSDVSPKGVALEGYSFGSKNSHAHGLGELGGLVKMSLASMGVPVVIVPPKTMQKIITGTGNGAGKGPVMVALYKRFGIEITQDDQADASALAVVAGIHFGGVSATLPKPNMDALSKVEPLASPFPQNRPRFRIKPDEKAATALQTA